MDHTVVVTSGSGGIGSAPVEELAADHDVVVYHYSNEAGAEDAVEAARTTGSNVIAVQADVSDRASVAALFERAFGVQPRGCPH